ncbi:MAG: HdeD family acid-resistance protein [Anaerolineales bacterium]
MAEAAMTSEQRLVPWWVVLIEGIAAIILGILLLVNPGSTTVILIQVLGIYWFIVGIIDIVRIFIDSSMWGWKLFSGIIGILAGILIIQHPLWSTLLVPAVLVWVFGFFGIIIGIIGLIQAFQGAGWGAGILGVLSILFGLLLIFNAFVAALTLPFIFGILGIVGGLAALVMAFQMR